MGNKKEFACILEPVTNQNHSLKKTMARICQETDLTWDKLPVALLSMCPKIHSHLVFMNYCIGDSSSILSS